MAAILPIKIEQGSTFKMKVTLKTTTGAYVPISGWSFEGTIKNSVYDEGGFPIKFELIDAINGSFYAIVDASVSDSMDFINGVYNVKFILANGEPYRLLEGPVELSLGV